MCNGKNCPVPLRLTFPNWHYMQSRPLALVTWPYSLCDAVHAYWATLVRNCELTLLGSDIKCITGEFLVGGTCPSICHLPGSPGIKVCATHSPCFFEARQPYTKGPLGAQLQAHSGYPTILLQNINNPRGGVWGPYPLQPSNNSPYKDDYQRQLCQYYIYYPTWLINFSQLNGQPSKLGSFLQDDQNRVTTLCLV